MEYFIQVFGCQMNRSDAERIAALFESQSFTVAAKPENADIFVAVMCSVRQMAADRVFGLEQKFKQIKKRHPGFKSILTGCIVETDKARFLEIFDFIFDIKALQQWPLLLGLQQKTIKASDYFRILPKNSSPFSALIPISKGCDNYCSYCVVPYTRGHLESRPVNDILREVKLAIANGAKEIWLLGQNVNNYHWQKFDFAKLLSAIDAIKGDFWIRFTSPHPKDFDAAAIKAMALSQKVTPYLNLPIQSGDDEILHAMKRPYTVKQYMKLVYNLRQAFRKYRRGMEANLAISTDVIVGFPGETKKQFNNTAKEFRKIKYDMAYIARYSRRPNTQAANLDDDITPREKRIREELINNILKKTALVHNKKYLGKIVSVLVDEIKNGTDALGKTRSYKSVKFGIKDRVIKPGMVVNVKITSAKSFGLAGKIADGK